MERVMSGEQHVCDVTRARRRHAPRVPVRSGECPLRASSGV